MVKSSFSNGGEELKRKRTMQGVLLEEDMKQRKLYVYVYSSNRDYDNVMVIDTKLVKSKRTFTKFKLYSN
jgi:uncharacterized protein YacL